MIKVLHAAETIKGGVATVMRQLAKGHIEAAGESSVLCLVPSSQSAELEGIPASSVITFSDQGRSLTSIWNFTIAFAKAVLREKPDIVHLHSSFAGAVGRTLLFTLRPVVRPRVIYCPHAFAFVMHSHGIKSHVYRIIEKFLSFFCDKIICVSQYEMDAALASGMSNEKLIVIHNGVTPPASVAPRSEIRAGRPLNLLFVGRFDYQKGFDILLDAMDLLNDFPVKLTAVGGAVRGSELPPTKRNVEYVGWIPSSQLGKYFMEADVLVFPSRWEGLAMVPLEAMSHGLPVIASDCTSNPEVVKDGETGYLFQTGSAFELAQIIRDSSGDSWGGMGLAGRKRVTELFTADAMLEKTESLYKKVISIW